MDDDGKTIQVKIREFVMNHRSNQTIARMYWRSDLLLMEAANRIDELEERVAIMSEDQYKSSEIRFP